MFPMANEDEQSPGEAQDDAQLWFRLRIKLTDTLIDTQEERWIAIPDSEGIEVCFRGRPEDAQGP